MNKERQYSLDFLRVIATTLIVFHHFQQTTGLYWEGTVNFAEGKFNFGYVVEFFFIMSGYFCYPQIEKIKDYSLKSFIVKKMIRLLPMVFISSSFYEIILLLYNKLTGDMYMDTGFNIWGYFLTITGLRNGWCFDVTGVNNPTWYISVLLLCYVVFYLSLSLSKRFGFSHVYLFIFIILIGCGIVTYDIYLPFFNIKAARGYYSFFLGLLIAEVIAKYKISFKLKLFYAIAIIFFITVMITQNPKDATFLATFIFYPSVLILFASFPMTKIFSQRIWGWMGRASYNVYVWHLSGLMIMDLFEKKGLIKVCSIWNMLEFTVLIWIWGCISYVIIEKPLFKRIQKKVSL